MILDHTIKTFKKKMEGFYKENEHLQSIQGERVKLVLKDKYANMENGAYTGPSFRSYKVDGNFFAFKIGTKENGQDICKRVSLRVEEGRRFLTFSKEEKDANGISLADFILGSPYVEGSFNCPNGTGIFEVYDPESRSKLLNDQTIKTAELLSVLINLRSEEDKINAIGDLLGFTGVGIEEKFASIIQAVTYSPAKVDKALTIVNNQVGDDLEVLSLIAEAKQVNSLITEGNKTLIVINGKKEFLVSSIKEETIAKKLKEKELILPLKGEVAVRLSK
jgi:regulator of extracellular matrix RemA (YlzA/DUF370 family)